jgi:hypothetical protein
MRLQLDFVVLMSSDVVDDAFVAFGDSGVAEYAQLWRLCSCYVAAVQAERCCCQQWAVSIVFVLLLMLLEELVRSSEVFVWALFQAVHGVDTCGTRLWAPHWSVAPAVRS